MVRDHPSIRRHATTPRPRPPEVLDAEVVRQLVLDAGADDVGFVEADRIALMDEVVHLRAAFPEAQSLISFVVRMNRSNVQSPERSLSNREFHDAGDATNHVARGVRRDGG